MQDCWSPERLVRMGPQRQQDAVHNKDRRASLYHPQAQKPIYLHEVTAFTVVLQSTTHSSPRNKVTWLWGGTYWLTVKWSVGEVLFLTWAAFTINLSVDAINISLLNRLLAYCSHCSLYASVYFAVPGRESVVIPEEMDGKRLYAPLPSNSREDIK